MYATHASGVNPGHRLGERPERVAILRALPGLGDLLCIIPALRALRTALPQAQVTLVGLPAARWFVSRFPRYVDRLLEFPGWPGLLEQPPWLEPIPAFLGRAQGQRFHLAVQMHGNGSLTNPITVLLGARLSAGFYLPGSYCPDPERFLLWVEEEPEVRRYLRLMEHLGVPSQGEELEFPLLEGDLRELRGLPEAREMRPGQYVCVHPGAAHHSRRWTPRRFAAVADGLASRGLRVVLTGSAGEVTLVQEVASAMASRPVDLAGRTSVGALAALLKGARLTVCNDTGVSHLAAALGVPSVIIFTRSNPQRWAPLDRQLHLVVHQHSADKHHTCSADLSRYHCAPDITPAMVLAQVDHLLQREAAYAT